MIDTRHAPLRDANACSIRAVISLHSCSSPRFCNSIVTPMQCILSLSEHCPFEGANRSMPGRAGLRLIREQPYPQIVLKTGRNAMTKIGSGEVNVPRLEKQSRLRASICAGDRKGCDIGYAPSASSCERANSVDACTIAALDAITAFAVPNPNCSSQKQSVFSGLVALQVALLSRSLSLLRTDKFYFAKPFSRRRRPN